MEKTMAKNRMSGAAGLLIFLGIVVALNVVVAGFALRLDMTEDRLYTLSNGTRDLLAELDREVTLKFYASRSAQQVPVPLKQFAQRVEELLDEYVSHSGGRVSLETFDPQPDSEEEEWAQRYGVASQPLGLLGGGPALYLGLVGVSGAREAVIPAISPNQEAQLEYLVTRLVHEVTQARKTRVGILSPLPVMGEPGGPPGMGAPAQNPWMFVRELRRLYEVREVPVSVEAVPEDVDVLVLLQPTGLSDATLFAVDQFLLKGGRLCILADPLCVAEREASPQSPMMAGSDLAGISKLFGAWGVSMDPGNLVADMTFATHVRAGQGQAARNVAWLTLRGDAIDREEVATGSLNAVLLPNTGYFSGEPKEGLSLTTLLQSSKESGTVNTFQAGFSPDGGVRSMTRSGERFRLATRLQGTFETAFPDGAPAAEDAGDEDRDTPEALKKSSADGVVVLLADADLLYDAFCVRARDFFGQTVYEPLNDNIAFFLNMMEQLGGSEALIGLRSRGTFDRPFTRVQELERQAQERWRQEEAELQDKLQRTQARLNQLQNQKDPTQKLIVSPAQQAEIKKFRQEQFEAQKALKEVRKNLRRDIEQLGARLKVVNMAAVPLGVAIFGLVLGLRRRRA